MDKFELNMSSLLSLELSRQLINKTNHHLKEEVSPSTEQLLNWLEESQTQWNGFC